MLRFIPILCILCLVLIAFTTFNLGMDWINFGHGLHPAAAFPVATIATLWATYWTHTRTAIYT